MSRGYVYALCSESCPHVKIGFTTTSPHQRVAEVNAGGVYAEYGKWHLIDCREVHDCRKVEKALHRRFADRQVSDYSTARELFAIPVSEALGALRAIPETEIIDIISVSKLLKDDGLLRYLHGLYRATGLENFFDAQEAWTFSLFPSTNGGERYFTLNIDNHEVAFSGLAKGSSTPFHCIVMDELIQQDREAMRWLKGKSAQVYRPPYKNAFPRSVMVQFVSEFDIARSFLSTGTVRRAVLAYWYDYLLAKTDRGTRSIFARFHNYNAVSEIFATMRESERFLSGK